MGMPPQTFDVRGNVPVAIAASPLPEPLTVLNMAVETVIYLSGEPGNKGFPLSPGSTMTWDSGQRLYITCDDGSVARIGVVFNGGQIIDSRALAQQIVAAGLADEIATKISLAGVPAIDRSIKIVDSDGPLLPGAIAGLTGGFIDVTGYSSLSGTINSLSQTVAYCELIVEQSDDATGTAFTQTRYTFVEGQTRFVIPLTSNYAALYLRQSNGTTFTYTARFSASYRERKETISSWPNPWAAIYGGETFGISQADLDIPAQTRVTYFPGWTNGPYRLSWGFATAANATANTEGVSVTYGPGLSAGYNTDRGRGAIGGLHTGKTIGELQTYEGYNSRLYPALIVANRNTTAQRINVHIQSPV